MPNKLMFLMMAFVAAPILAQEAEPLRKPLFHIERSKNANIVQYDALLDSNGNLLEEKPVTSYWIRHADEGEIKQLSWVQKKWAYGFKINLNPEDNTAELDMAAKIGRRINVIRIADEYRAVTDINGVDSILDRIFINSRGKGLSTKVDYIDLFGHSISDQVDQYERIIP